jgi:cellulose 1,4-beta-cellobiosidase
MAPPSPRRRPHPVPTVLAALVLAAVATSAPAHAAPATVGTAAPTVAGTSAATTIRVDNPYLQARVYVNPEWSARAAAEPGGAAIANQPTAVWLDRIAAIEGTDDRMGLRDHLDAALAQGADLVQLVLYNLPGRDCDRRVSHGELSAGELGRYRDEFVEPVADILADPAYAGLRIVVIVEPNSLPNLITHTSPRPAATAACDTALATGSYLGGIGHALARLGTIANVYPYLDLGDHGQLGRPEDIRLAAQLAVLVANTGGSRLDNVHGFITNTARYSPVREPFIDVTDVIDGVSVRDTTWVGGNLFVDELPYAQALRTELIHHGFPSGIGMLIDTSRNGWGGPDRPTGPGPRTTAEEYVEASRIDRRGWVGSWCNQSGAGLGERPTAVPAPGIDAFVWAKPPGESDGASDVLGAHRPYEPMCDPWYRPTQAPHVRTGALGDAPPFGAWFPEHFRQLLANAWPPL